MSSGTRYDVECVMAGGVLAAMLAARSADAAGVLM
jgi:hypothetical protein